MKKYYVCFFSTNAKMQAPREWGPKAHRSVLRSCARGINSGRAESRRPLAPREMHVDFEVGVVDEVAGRVYYGDRKN